MSFCFRARILTIKVRKHFKIKDECCLFVLGFIIKLTVHTKRKQNHRYVYLKGEMKHNRSRAYYLMNHFRVFPVLDSSSIPKCSSKSLKSCFFGAFPIFSWLHAYKRNDFIGDVISGATVAIMHIPQVTSKSFKKRSRKIKFTLCFLGNGLFYLSQSSSCR